MLLFSRKEALIEKPPSTIMKRTLTDAEIVEGLLLREERLTNRIVEQLYHANKNAIGQLVYKCGGTTQDAEDIFQEMIVIFLENVWRNKFSLSDATISTYLYGIAKKVWFRRNDKNKKEEKHTAVFKMLNADIESDTPDKMYLEAEEKETLLSLFQRLPKAFQEVLEAYYIEELSMQEIMDKLNLPSVASAKMRKMRGIQEWRELLFQNQLL